MEKALNDQTTPGQGDIRLRRIWTGMKTRCNNRNVPEYPRYGGSGVTICAKWLVYEQFQKWAKRNGYTDELTIERIDTRGNYEPGNCTWIPKGDQAKNRRDTVYITIGNKTKRLAVWAEEKGLAYNTLYSRISRGWEPEEALQALKQKGGS